MNKLQVTAIIKENPVITVEGPDRIMIFTGANTERDFEGNRDPQGRGRPERVVWIHCRWFNPPDEALIAFKAKSCVWLIGEVCLREDIRLDGTEAREVGIDIVDGGIVDKFGRRNLHGRGARPSRGKRGKWDWEE